MNVQEIRLLWNNFKNVISGENKKSQKHVMTEEEMLDETLKESFPASDPPGHISTSAKDKELH